MIFKYSAEVVPLQGDDGPLMVGVQGVNVTSRDDCGSGEWTDNADGSTTFLYGHEVWHMGEPVTEGHYTTFYAHHAHDTAPAAPSMSVRMFL